MTQTPDGPQPRTPCPETVSAKRIIVLSRLESDIRRRLRTLVGRHRLNTHQEVLLIGIVSGRDTPRLAEWTDWSLSTIETYLKGLYTALGAHGKEEIFAIALPYLLDPADQEGGREGGMGREANKQILRYAQDEGTGRSG